MILALVGMMVMAAVELPTGSSPDPVACPHFPDRLHAYVWRNWGIAPVDRLAKTIGASPEQFVEIGRAMGLSGPPEVTLDQFARSSITVIKRNWQILPYEQLLELLDWTPEKMAYHLREDDFLFIKLGMLKPKCDRLAYVPPDANAAAKEKEIASVVKQEFPGGVGVPEDKPLGFVARLSAMPAERRTEPIASNFSPRYCFSFFGLTGDPFLGNSEDIYPDGLLARLADCGVDGVWLQGVLYTLAPFPWDAAVSDRYEERLEKLRGLVSRAKKFGIGIYLYLNEPRAMSVKFYEDHPELKGVAEGDYAALCTSHPDVQKYIRGSVASICRAVPDLRGFFSISASENLTNCYSHYQGAHCPRCGKRMPEEVVAELITLYEQGVKDAGTNTEVIAWDWGWQDSWAEGLIGRLPTEVGLMSVSEWSIPIERGGVASTVGEYSISVIGPGPRATRHWQIARDRGLKTLAKVQVGNTWENGGVPYIPAVKNVAQHMANLRKANVSGLMLSWTLGGYPSPSLEVAAEMGRSTTEGSEITTNQAMNAVATRRFGASLAPSVVDFWTDFSDAFGEYPYSGGLIYVAPVHVGASNPLWEKPTGYGATMVGFPYDDLKSWLGCYPPDVFIGQFEKVAAGFETALSKLRESSENTKTDEKWMKELALEAGVAEACAIHFKSTANQARFVIARNRLADAKTKDEGAAALKEIENTLNDEIAQAKRLFALASVDSRLGYEASNQYYYLPVDLAEKVLNCHDLLNRWLPSERERVDGLREKS